MERLRADLGAVEAALEQRGRARLIARAALRPAVGGERIEPPTRVGMPLERTCGTECRDLRNRPTYGSDLHCAGSFRSHLRIMLRIKSGILHHFGSIPVGHIG